MDQTLIDIFQSVMPPKGSESSVAIFKVVDIETGEIEIACAGGNKKYVLKPLSELFSNGLGASSIDLMSEQYMPLLYRIENDIMNFDDDVPDLTDGMVSLALDRITMNPAAAPGNDRLCQHIQLGLRILLSRNDYS